MNTVPELFGSMVFSDTAMREYLPADTYKALKSTMVTGHHLELDIADAVAGAMKDWALERGATHFTHWFQPMTGVTAEKHDSFVAPQPDGTILMEFSGRELVRGEPDASSFPTGGLRATFEARGYTAWDPTSYAFIKDGTLCIPTAFCSYGGHALDKKTPLLRSMDALNKQALRILRLFGDNETKRVVTTIGAEQEYFLVDREVFEARLDLKCCGRTLFGAKPPKGQEMDDHYFGSLKPRVAAFMRELDEELWKLGVPAKTEHNETAPGQHELAQVFATANIAADHNQITMELLRSVAARHGMACLLHEKPFAGVNGSGKHNNWSLTTDTGINLLEPGETPVKNARFLLFLCAVLSAADDYQELLRASVASAGNDHRLTGKDEAPPSIVSVFLGEELTEILESIENETKYSSREHKPLEIGVTALPHIPCDTTDRNRTSPFAFTGNRFEFRMPGSSLSVADPAMVFNTAVADTLCGFADVLEQGHSLKKDLDSIIRTSLRWHKRIIFNGNNYDAVWAAEAAKRGLSNLKNTPEALSALIAEKNIELFERQNVLTATELRSRCEIMLESYGKTVRIEAMVLLEMAEKEILPAVFAYQNDLAKLALRKQQLNIPVSAAPEEKLLQKLSELTEALIECLAGLRSALPEPNGDAQATAEAYGKDVSRALTETRQVIDELEQMTGKPYWHLPDYAELLYSVH